MWRFIKILILTGTIALGMVQSVCAQPVPAGDENIPYLMTFGKEGATSWGDDDFSQIQSQQFSCRQQKSQVDQQDQASRQQDSQYHKQTATWGRDARGGSGCHRREASSERKIRESNVCFPS